MQGIDVIILIIVAVLLLIALYGSTAISREKGIAAAALPHASHRKNSLCAL